MLRETIESGLFSPDRNANWEVFGFLEEKQRWIDLRPFVATLERYIGPTGRNDGAWLADEVEFFRASRQDRIEVCRRAIVEGATTLRRGDTILRNVAMSIAADEGLEELTPLIEEYYDQLPPVVKTRNPRAKLLESMELRAGASDREDAIERACGRLAAMSDSQFKQKMDADVQLQNVVLELVQEACKVDPFVPHQNPGCALLTEIMRRQQIEAQKQRENSTAQSTSAAGSGPKDGADWLFRLGTWVQ